MNIFLTMDYEVFFGDTSGSVEKCMIEPTNELMAIADKNDFRFTFFWDVGHFLALEKFASVSETLRSDYKKIEKQVKALVAKGHAVELHIHPHWEKAEWVNEAWQMNLDKHYKISDFQIDERKNIFKKYKEKLEEVTQKSTSVFRAGGWCIQPFTDFKALFEEHNIRIDSSVMPGIKWQSEQYNLDFQKVSTQDPYFFDADVCEETETGAFLEVPIASRWYSPLFFWKLYGLGRLFPTQHKMWGDGNFVGQPGGKKEMLTKGKLHHVSTDGFYASELENSFEKMLSKGHENMCVIGHPKSLTRYALKKIDAFTARNTKNKRFKTLTELL